MSHRRPHRRLWRLALLPAVLPLSPASAAVAEGEDGVWHFLNEPRPVVADGLIHVGVVDRAGHVKVVRWGSSDGSLHSTVTLRENWRVDDHLNPSMVRLPGEDGRLLATAARGGDLHLFYAQPGDTTRWETRTIKARDGNFPHPVVLGERVLLVSREQTQGDKRPHLRVSDDSGQTFGRQQPLIDSGHWLYPKAKVIGNSLHLLLTSNPAHRASNPVYYLHLEGDRFFNARGEPVGSLSSLPLAESAYDVVYPPATDELPVRAVDLTVDRDGRPVILHVMYHGEGSGKQTYRASRWTGQQWRHEFIADTTALSSEKRGWVGWVYFGGLTFHPSDPDTLYASVEALSGRRVIRAFHYCPDQARWELGRVVAQGQRGDALRPWTFSDQAVDWMIWLDGRIKRYNNFDTEPRLTRLAEEDR